MTLSIGTTLSNRYRIVSVLGQGGMGAVYRAFDENLSVDVAVKENLFLADEYVKQFQLEATILAGLHHPNLPKVIDHFTIPNQGQYLVMGYIDGEDLRQRIERMNSISEREAVLIGAAICDALTYLHNRQSPIIHRDIKPGNIKITPRGEIYLVDFGLAKVMQDNQATTNGARAMTPGYSSPEQYGLARTDPRSDIYSLGATLYAALTGIIPEDGLARATGKNQLTPLREYHPHINQALAESIEKALILEPNDRYQTAEEFKQALLDAGEISRPTREHILVTPPPANRPRSRGDSSSNSQSRPAANGKPITSPPNRFNLGCVVILLLIAGLLGGLLYLQPQLPRLISDSFMPTLIASRSTTIVPPGQITLTPQTIASPSPTPKDKNATAVPTAATLNNKAPTQVVAKDSPTPLVTSTPIGGGAGQIAYSSMINKISQIWMIDSDGRRPTQISSVPAGACQPSWSPDGKQIAFISPCDGKHDQYKGSQLFIMNADGSNVRAVFPDTDSQGDYDPAWSPTGKQIAYTSLRGGRTRLYIFDLAENRASEISDTRYEDKQPSWNPDGTRLAFIRTFELTQIYIYDLRTKKSSEFSPASFSCQWPAWSADGRTIYYGSSPGASPILWRLNINSHARGDEKNILPIGDLNSMPIQGAVSSPDSAWISFEAWPGGDNHDIYIMGPNGENPTRITSDPAFDFSPAWRPVLP